MHIDTSMFDLKFQPPQNFAAYRQTELDNQRIGTWSQVQAIPYISNRFALERFLGLSTEDIAKNERLWKEENQENLEPPPGDASGEMRGVGISSAGISADIDGAEETADIEGAEDGGEGAPPETATGEELGGAPAPAGGGDAGTI